MNFLSALDISDTIGQASLADDREQTLCKLAIYFLEEIQLYKWEYFNTDTFLRHLGLGQ